jgi:competence protein ComEC
MTLLTITIAWTLGIILARQIGLAAPVWGWLALAAVPGLLYAGRRGQSAPVAWLLVGLLCGGWRYAAAQPTIGPHHLAHYNDQGRATVQGYISAEPVVRGRYTQVEVSAWQVETRQSHEVAVRGRLIVNVPHYPAFEYGDAIQISGSLETPPILDTFSYKEHLAARGVHSLLRNARVEPLGQRRGSGLLRWMYAQKRALRRAIEGALPNPDAGLLSGILLGLDYTLPDDLAEDFRATGLTHIIVISGFNISLITQAVVLSTRRLFHRYTGLWISLGVIALFTLFVGPTPPVLRAALMGGVFLLGQLLGRRSRVLASLALASLVMTTINPLLLWSVSYQLSFASTLALVLLEPILARRAHEWMMGWAGADRAARWVHPLRDILIATTAAQIMTLPVAWYHFRQMSLIALLANVLVLPVQPAILFLGAAVAGLGALWLPLGRLAAPLIWPFLRYSIVVVQSLARLPWAAVEMPVAGPLAVWAIYGAIMWVIVSQRSARADLPRPPGGGVSPRAALTIAIPAMVAVLVWAAIPGLPDGRLHVYALDVGQGDAILIRTPGGRHILVDGGPDPVVLTSRLGQVLPFWQRRIDLVVATHADQDHLAGLVPVIERYHVTHVLEPPGMRISPLSTHWRQGVEAAGVEIIPVTAGARITLGEGIILEVLSPPPDVAYRAKIDDNQASIVIMLRMGQCNILLTGDAEAEAERRMLADGHPLQAAVIKVGHHGSESSSTAPFLAAVNPQIALIGVGADNRYGHPREAVLQRLDEVGATVYRTDRHGTIQCTTDGNKLWVRPHRP